MELELLKQRRGNERVAIFVPVIAVGREYILAFVHRVLHGLRDIPPELNIVMPCDCFKGGGVGFIRGAIKGIDRGLSYAGAYTAHKLVGNFDRSNKLMMIKASLLNSKLDSFMGASDS